MMWTQEHERKYKVEQSKARCGNPKDVSDQEWALMEPLLPGKARTCRPRRPRNSDFPAVINPLRYLARTGCEWRMLADAYEKPKEDIFKRYHGD